MSGPTHNLGPLILCVLKQSRNVKFVNQIISAVTTNVPNQCTEASVKSPNQHTVTHGSSWMQEQDSMEPGDLPKKKLLLLLQTGRPHEFAFA